MALSRRTFLKQGALAASAVYAGGLTSSSSKKNNHDHLEAFRNDLQSAFKALRLPGMIAAVVKDGKIVFDQAEGYADPEKKELINREYVFPVASLTKTFASIIIQQYVQENKLSWDDYILNYPFLSVGYQPERVPDPNVRIKHIMGHTSEGRLGHDFVYNGSRYNFVYGVYEKLSGNTHHYDAFAQEVSNRIIAPLKLEKTYPGFPTPRDGSLKIAKTYNFDSQKKDFSIRDNNESTWTTLFPATNLFTTIDDLAKYTTALDDNLLLTAESYHKITSPFITPSGKANPYGLGWCTQQVSGHALHWHYGYGDSFAALIVRVPDKHTTFLFFSNAVPPSEAFLLGYGNVLNSPFALSFFKHFILPDKEAFDSDELIAKALLENYREKKYGLQVGGSVNLLRRLAQTDPMRFKNPDISLIWLMAQQNPADLKPNMEMLITAYRNSGYFHPEIHEQIAEYYWKNNSITDALNYAHLLADSRGFEEQQSVRNACIRLGRYYLQHGEQEKGRQYLWREVLYNRYTDNQLDDAEQQLKIINGKG